MEGEMETANDVARGDSEHGIRERASSNDDWQEIAVREKTRTVRNSRAASHDGSGLGVDVSSGSPKIPTKRAANGWGQTQRPSTAANKHRRRLKSKKAPSYERQKDRFTSGGSREPGLGNFRAVAGLSWMI